VSIDEVTPGRLGELADGAPPETAAEREAVALMADVRALEEPVPAELERRVRAIGRRASQDDARARRVRGRRRLLALGAPVAAAAVAALIAIPLLRSGGSDDGGPAAAGGGGGTAAAMRAPAPEAAQATPTPRASRALAGSASASTDDAKASAGTAAPSGEPAAVRRARAVIAAAGGRVLRVSGTPPVMIATVPWPSSAQAFGALRRLGAQVTGSSIEARGSAQTLRIALKGAR
jgi:hypothetical protein